MEDTLLQNKETTLETDLSPADENTCTSWRGQSSTAVQKAEI